MTVDPTSAGFFEAKYRADTDPWHFATDPYELRRYATIVDAVGPEPFRRAFEPACSIGVLTAMLAPRCASLLATDASPSAVAAARARVVDRPPVEVVSMALPEMPPGPFDLIVFSEVGYYFPPDPLADLVDDLITHLAPGGRLVAAHWTGQSGDHVLDGATVHRTIDRHPELTSDIATRDEGGFLLGRWHRSVPR
ncbi:SAM-dependent methyltransferase [soil metagenome]